MNQDTRLIDKDALLDVLEKVENSATFAARIIHAQEKYTAEKYSAESIIFASLSVVRDVINDAPAIHATDQIRHGHWICEYDWELGETDVTCSVCRDTRTVNGCYVSHKGESLYHDDNFCPYCGAKMDERDGGTQHGN